MRSWKTPTPEQVSQAVAQLGRAEHRRYFFDMLKNPRWLEPLVQKGFFRNPPPAQRDDSDGTISFPIWPESRYLARMAKLSEAQQSVVKIALSIPDTENIQVHSDLADVALALPVGLAVKFVPKARRWLESPYELLLPEKLGMLVSRLAEGGEAEKSIRLAQGLLAVLPDPRSGTAAAAGLEKYTLLHPIPRFSVWQYKQVLEKNIPSLVDAGGERTLNLLCDCLDAAIRLSRQPSDATAPNDYSWIWRPAVENHEQNRNGGLKDALVDAIRDAAERLAKKNPACLPSLVGLLERRPWQIFPRIALHLLRRFPEQVVALIEERLADHARFDSPGLRHEYSLLAAACFTRISSSGQDQLLNWIAQGPDLEMLKKGHREANGVEASDDEVAGWKKWWQRDRLAPLKEALPQAWKERYDALVKELGEPSHPEFMSYTSGGWVGPTSPKSQEDIQSMGVADVVRYLRTWTPPEGIFAHSPEGLARAVAAAVAIEPARFAKEAGSFQGLDPTYVRELLSGLRDATRQGRAFDWQPVLDLCAWVMTQPREIAGRRQRSPEVDADWGWTRKGIADLLSAGMQKGKGEIPIQLRDQCWKVLAALASDPQPTSEYESQYGGSNMDAATMSINTVRGQAMHAVIHYGLWVMRNLGSPVKGFDEMPEVRGLLEAHLDLQRETSLTVRSVYGQWFPWLVVMDPKWATGKASSIFPESNEQIDLWRAAWDTYVTFCEPFNNTYRALAGTYRLAVERLAPHPQGEPPILLPEKRLAEHVMVYYWRGQVPLSDGDELLSRFYEKAWAGLRGEALEHVGRSLRASPDPIPPAIMDRLRKLWDTRLALARSASSIEDFGEELSHFGWWFASGKFEEEWALTQLVEVVETWKRAEPPHLVAQRLAEIAGRWPGQAVRALAGLVKADTKGWRLAGFRSEAESILMSALASGDQQVRQRAVDLINKLGERGNFDYRELLRAKC